MSRGGEQVLVDLPRLVDLSVGTPNAGNINSALLHTLLHTIIRRLEMEDCRIEFRGSSAMLIRDLLPLVEESPIFLTEYAILPDNERIIVPPPKISHIPSNVYVAEKRNEMSKDQIRKLHLAVSCASKRSKQQHSNYDYVGRPKMYEPSDDDDESEKLQNDINQAISEALPPLLEDELAKFVDLKARIETMERQIRYLTNIMESEREDFFSRPASVKSEYSQMSEKRAPGFLAKEQMDLVLESLLRDKDGRFFSKLEDRIRNTLLRDMQREILNEMNDKIKVECSKDKITHDMMNNRLQQIESDLLKAMKDLEDMLNKCQGDEIRSILDARLGDIKDRLTKLEKASRKSSIPAPLPAPHAPVNLPQPPMMNNDPCSLGGGGGGNSGLGSGGGVGGMDNNTTTCELCPESKCLTCCQIAAQQQQQQQTHQSGKVSPDLPTTPKSASSGRRSKERSASNSIPRRLSQKSKSEIQFDPSFFQSSGVGGGSGSAGTCNYNSRDNNCSMEEIKPVPPAKTRGKSYTLNKSRSLSHPECDQCAQECSFCLNEQLKARTLPCGCVCSDGGSSTFPMNNGNSVKRHKKRASKSARTSRSSSKEKSRH